MLKGKNVILTGATRGIGNAILRIFAQNHANMWCLVRRADNRFIDHINKLCSEYDIWIKIITADLESEESIHNALSYVFAEKQSVDILVNNAAVNAHGAFMMTTRHELDRIFQINFFAQIQIIQMAAKKMIRQKQGNIINITSASGFEHNLGNFSYAATKTLLNWSTQTISRELAPYNIRVNAVAPGVTDTDMNNPYEDGISQKVMPTMNIRRKANPMEIAEGVLFLAGDKSSFISGQIIKIDGGRFNG